MVANNQLNCNAWRGETIYNREACKNRNTIFLRGMMEILKKVM